MRILGAFIEIVTGDTKLGPTRPEERGELLGAEAFGSSVDITEQTTVVRRNGHCRHVHFERKNTKQAVKEGM